jgi:quinoprotein glucose dehydrogenase
MSVDEARDLLFLPTGNPTPDYANAHRRGLDTYGSSLVVLRASTGRRVWHFQTVHNDLWDFDVPAQPTLFPLEREGRRIPAVVQATKMGLLFTFDRESGEPLFPIEERPVPQGAEPGLVLSPTQPFPLRPPPLVRHELAVEEAFGFTPWDRGVCRRRLESVRWEGIYTPPSSRGTLMFPGNSGGSNWGGVAVDPERQLLVANVMDLAWQVTLIPPDEFERARAERPGRCDARFSTRRWAFPAIRRPGAPSTWWISAPVRSVGAHPWAPCATSARFRSRGSWVFPTWEARWSRPRA